jgi:hypothetical protein
MTIKQTDKWKYINMNPKAPHIYGTIKLHKADKCIRPIVNWKNSPGYKLAKYLEKLLKNTMQLPNAFNVQNSETLMHSLKQINTHKNIKMCSFDIKNMYTNIPLNELTNIIHTTLTRNNIPNDYKKEIMTLVNVTLQQNYFQHNDELYTQNEGLAMGAPTSAILAEIFIQYLEHNNIIQILQKHQILDYYRYVDDILIIYNEEHTNILDTLNDFNLIHPNIQYTIEMQTDNKLNYLDITIENNNGRFTFNIYRKPTTTDLIIPYNSCHPTEHKLAAIRYMTNRKNTYPISTEYKQNETQIINTILHNNGYTTEILKHKKKKQKNTIPNETRKWSTFTYVGKETRVITRLFRNTNIHIAYKTNNTLQKHLQIKNIDPDKYNNSGIYEIKCNSCQLKYIGQTGRNFKTRYKEHIQAIHTNKTTSRYAQHILETGHAYGTIKDTLNILHYEKKGPLMNTLERFHIHKLTKDGLQLNDTYADTHNPIFDLIATHYK